MTAEIFDVDHEPTPRAVSLAMTDPVCKLNVCYSTTFLILFCISFCPCVPLGKTGQKINVSQSLRDLLSYQNDFGYIQCHLKFWTYVVGALVDCMHWPCGKDILGGPRSYLRVGVQKVFCSLSCHRICLLLIDQIKNPLPIPMPHSNCCFSWISVSSLVYYKASRYEIQGQKSRKEFLAWYS